jgi:hypothetical protein
VQLARIYALKDTPMADDKKAAEEKRRVETATEYLERGLRLATPKDGPRDVFDAQMLLVRFLAQTDRVSEAAVLGEALARTNPKVPRAALAAQMAVYAYNTSAARLKAAGGADEDVDADVGRLKRLALFADATWPTDPPTDAVRHVLAFYQANRDKDYDAAWKTYSKITTGYPDLYQARREMAAALFYLVRPEDRDPKTYRDQLQKNITDRAAQWRATMAALAGLPDPAPDATAHEAEAWAGARTMQAQLYYLAGDHDRVQATVKAAVEGLKKQQGLDDKKAADLAYTARALHYNALQARAADFLRAREFAKVGEVLGPELEALKAELKLAPPAEPPPGFDRMRRAQLDLLIAAMSGYVQDKQSDKASQLLDVLQGAGGSLESNLAVLRQLVTAIRTQIDTLKKGGHTAEADDLARSFTEFLDKIKGEDTSKLPQGVVLFLGQGYAAVDQPARAAELFEQLAAKPFDNPGKTAEQQEEAAARHETFVRQLRFYQARALRQAGGKANLDKARGLMRDIVGDPLAKDPAKKKPGWGYRNLDVRKEYCLLLEEQKLWGLAGNNWTLLAAEFGGAVRGAPPAPIKFLGLRPAFVAVAKAIDEAAVARGFPARFAAGYDAGFKSVYPALAERRAVQRQHYFDIFVELQRCSARSYSAPEVAAKVGPDRAQQRLTDVGQRLYDLVTRNEDIGGETRERVREVLDLYPPARKKFDELVAAAPKS